MATQEAVKNYVAQWLELGKPLQVGDRLLILAGVRHQRGYSPEFEELWRGIMAEPSQFSLANVPPTIAELLQPAWEVDACPRCAGLIALPIFIYTDCLPCPCSDLANLPNLELMMPHPPVNDRECLARVADRLQS
jgi:hypothetical protein